MEHNYFLQLNKENKIWQSYIDPVRTLTISGNSPTENAILSIAEAQVLGVLNNDVNTNTMFFRTSAIADQIATLNELVLLFIGLQNVLYGVVPLLLVQ